MGSRKEEERNEKVIRGLMKLPPNRRCINCNGLGPHREFTHRVKSVSMSKFTSQEVEALQNGGNKRAREIYLKDWDLLMGHSLLPACKGNFLWQLAQGREAGTRPKGYFPLAIGTGTRSWHGA